MDRTLHEVALVSFAGKVWNYLGPWERKDGTMAKRTAGHGRNYPGYFRLENPETGQIQGARNDRVLLV